MRGSSQYKTAALNGVFAKKNNTPNAQLMTSNHLDKWMDDEVQRNNGEPWCKLSRTAKHRKLSEYVKTYSSKHSMTIEKTEGLQTFLTGAIDDKRLTRVKDIVYDNATGIVIDIPGLLFNTSSNNFTLKNTEKQRVSTLKSLTVKSHHHQPKPVAKEEKVEVEVEVEGLLEKDVLEEGEGKEKN